MTSQEVFYNVVNDLCESIMTTQEEFDNVVNDLCESLESENYHSEMNIVLSLRNALINNKVPLDVAVKIIQETNFW